MKFCPVCQTQYDEEIMRFCTKDGTPLVDEETPNFIEMPSENLESSEEEDDFGAATIIRRKPPEPEVTNVEPRAVEKPQRMTIPTTEQTPAPVPAQQQVRTKQTSYQQQLPPKKTSTAAVVLLTFLGTVIVLGGGLGIYWLMNGGSGETVSNSNSNINANQDTNLNTNLNIDNSLFNINSNTNSNTNLNANIDVNANLKSPTPTPTRSPSPSKTPTPSPTPDDDDSNSGNSNSSGAPVNTRPTPNASPRTTPTAAPPSNSPVNVGNLNSRAVSLSKPAYPPAARQMRASGPVPVLVTLDETGRVIAAKATSGHPLLRQAAENAAKNSRFDPVRVSGQAVKSVGTVVYNFVGN